jgi:nitrate reductase gamma subunit
MEFFGYHVLPYVAALASAAGLGWRVWLWWRTPQPWQVVLMPAPRRLPGVWARLGRELMASPSLWRGQRALWAGSGLFHLCLLLVLLKHLRLVLNPVPDWVVWLQAPGSWAGALLPLTLLYLLARRLADDRLLLLSTRADYLLLALLLALAASGLWLKLGPRVPLEEVKDYLLGLATFSPRPAPAGGAFALHGLLALVLMLAAPFTKLLHGLAFFFNPVLAQRDSALLTRRVNPWDSQVEEGDLEARDLVEGERPFFTPGCYEDYLKYRWASAGVHRVMGAAERAATLPAQGRGHGP